MAALTPNLSIIYQNKDVSKDFAPLIKSVSYTDSLEGKASSIEISLRNDKKLFMKEWYPSVDDKMLVNMGYEGEVMLSCGEFWIDEVTLSGSSAGDMTTIRGVSLKSSEINSSKNTRCYLGESISNIVTKVALRLGYEVVGDLSGVYSGTQNCESDLAFLQRLAREAGRFIKIEGSKLIFYKITDLEKNEALSLDITNVKSYNITDKAAGRVSKCTCRWWNETTKKSIEGVYNTGIKGGADIVIREAADSSASAAEKAKDFVENRNKKGVEVSLNMVGDVRFKAGVKVLLTSFGKFSDTYYISETSHTVSQGYTTNLKLKKWLK